MTYPQPVGSVELKFEFPVSTSPTGLELVFGATVIPAESQDFIPSAGVTHSAFGEHSVRDPRLLATGFDATEFGATFIELATPNVYPEGFDSLEFGDTYIADKPEPTQVTLNSDSPGVSGVDGFEPGTAEVAHFLRYISVEYSPQEEWGTAFIGDRYRYLYPDGAVSATYGEPEVTFPKELLPLGLNATQFGTADVGFLNVAFPAGVTTATVGQPWASFRVRYVTPFAQQYIEWGSHKVDLWQRYLLVNHPPESNATGEKYGQYTEVRNRNRTVGPVGLLAQKFSTSPAYLELTGRAVLPPSIDDIAFGGGTFISYRVRSMRVPGYELDRYPNNTTVYNYAATIRANSLSSFVAGTPSVEKLLKFVTVSGHRADSYGTQWASFSSRSVRPVGSDLGGRNNAHYVSHSPYIVQFAGLGDLRTGAPFVYIRPPIMVYASWGQLWVQDQKQMGIPRVRRYPPLIEVPGRPYTEFSYPAARVDFRVRTLQPPTVDGQEKYGNNIIRDRAFTIRVDGSRATEYGFPEVENELTIIVPTTQYLLVSEHNILTDYGRHHMEQRWLNPPSLDDTAKYGEPEVQGNSIVFEPRHHPSPAQGWTAFGMVNIPGPRRLTGVGAGPMSVAGHPRIAPFHVYCTPDYPRGVERSYPENLHYSSFEMEWGGGSSGADLVTRFGDTAIVHPHTRRVTLNPQPDLNHKAEYGDHTLYHGTQEVFPPSFNPFRSGTPQMWPHPQDIGARGVHTLVFGAFTFPPEPRTPYLNPLGLEAFSAGDSAVVHFHQRLYQEGADHAVLGADTLNPSYNGLTYPIVGDWLRVFPSYDATEYGAATNVTNYIRYIYPEPHEGEWGDSRVMREIQTVFLKGDDQIEFGIFDNTREMKIRPYSVQFLCSTSPYTQVFHA